MSQMTYFRRPSLVGTSLRRPPTPTLRGNRRRKNADTSQALPYFDGLPANGGTFQVETLNLTTGLPEQVEVFVQASTAGVAGFAATIAGLNAAATFTGASLAAFDADGCLGIRSTQVSSSANVYVKVIGGTAAAALGFNVNQQAFFSKAGDQPSAPEGRIGNPFDAALPPPGESLTTETFTRALGRMMANSDVLFSELMRQEIVYKKIAAASGPNSTLDLGDLAAGQKVFTDGGPTGGLAGNVLNASSTPATLTRFFFLVDRSSGRQSRSAVVGVTHHDGSQALGTEKQVLSSDILDIPNGRVVRIGSTSGVLVGDYAKITGASNRGWTNNGYRWVVEEVMADGQHLALRPMSSQELTRVAETADDHHPFVELCIEKESGGSFGTLTIYKGPFADDVTLTISPPLVAGQYVDIWAAVPSSYRDHPIDALAAPSFTPYTPYVTVGTSGDFADLAKALSWISTSPGADAIEIILLENQTAPAGGWTIPQSLRIRGAHPRVSIAGTSGGIFTEPAGNAQILTLRLADLVISPTVPLISSLSVWLQALLSDVGASYPVAGPDSTVNVDIGSRALSVLVGKANSATTVRGFLTAASYIQAGNITGAAGARLTFDSQQGMVTFGKVGEQDVNLTKDQVDVLVGGSGSDAQSLHKHQDLVTALATETATRGQNDATLQAHIDAEATARGQADLDIRNWADARYLPLTGGTLSGWLVVGAYGNPQDLGVWGTIYGYKNANIYGGVGVYNPDGYTITGGVVAASDVQGVYGRLELSGQRYGDTYPGYQGAGEVHLGRHNNIEKLYLHGSSMDVTTGKIDLGWTGSPPNYAYSWITGVRDPLVPTDAANKSYVDAKSTAASYTPVMDPGRIYKAVDSYLTTSSGAWTRVWDLNTGPIRTGFSVAQGVSNPTSYKLVVHFVFNGFTSTNQYGDIFTRVAVVNQPYSGDPFSASGYDRLAYVSGIFVNSGPNVWAGSQEVNWNVPDDASHWICHCRYVFDVSDTPNGLHIAIDVRSNGTSIISGDELGDAGWLLWIKPSMPWVAHHTGHQAFVYVM